MKKGVDIAAVKERLIKRRRELQENNLSRSELSEESGDVKDVGDEASLISSQQLQRTLGETDLSEIKLIDQSLARLESGEYGICVDCEGEISDARLDYSPYAVRCIMCQEALDS